MKYLLSLVAATALFGGNTNVLFQPDSPSVGPFPNNSLTVSDPTQKTGLRINLPLPPACGSPLLSACVNTALLNQLDGFSINPRITVCFSGPIDPRSLNGAIQIISVNAATSITINQTIYDPAANCVHAKPDRVLLQDTSYLLVVNDSLNDADSKKVKPEKSFTDCLKTKTGSVYCAALSAAVEAVGEKGNKLISASLFTTMSATDWLEKARNIAASGPPIVIPAGLVSTFSLTGLTSISYFPQDNSGKNTVEIPISALSGVETVSFGLYLSPNFTNLSGPAAGSISVTPTRGPIAGPIPIPGLPADFPGLVPISFHVFLPPISQKPQNGFPVVIYGHGLGDTQFGAPTFIASTLAKQGIATLAFEVPGHGFGPLSYLKLVDGGRSHYVSTPGRGIQLSAGGPYGATDGCILPGALAVRDCGRQAAVDLSALVHTIQGTDGLGKVLDPTQISFIGQSFGGSYGTLFHAVEPAVARAVLNGTGGTSVDVSRLAISGRPLAAFYLATNNPPLLNVPPANPEPYFHDSFNDNYVFRDMPPVVNNIPGALPIQAAFEVADWLGMVGDPLAFAPHLKDFPLPGVPAKATLFQFGLGDLEVPNPTESAVVRAADGLSSTWFFRFDQAVQAGHPELLGVTQPGSPLPILPHRYLSNPTIFGVPAETSIALATQMQAASFFKGNPSPDPNPFLTSPFIGVHLFEIPAVLPERLNFLQIQP